MKREGNLTLDDVLNEFVAEYEQPTAEAVEKWARRYPQYSDDLIDFAAAWAELLTLPPGPELSAEQEQSLVERGIQYMIDVSSRLTEGTSPPCD